MSQDKEDVPPPEESPPEVTEGTEEEAPPTPPEKKVGINDDPEIFVLDPNSTEVTPVEKPAAPPPPGPEPAEPCPPPIDQKHLEQIIADTLDIIDKIQRQSYDQKLGSLKLAFMLDCIKDNLCGYRNFVETINAFLVNNEKLQSTWFCGYRGLLQCFGDYTLVLKENSEVVKVDDLPFPVPESQLKSLADRAVKSLIDGGSMVTSQRELCKIINDKLDIKRGFAEEHMAPFDSWFFLLNKAAGNQDYIMDFLFEISSILAFIKTGEACGSIATLDIGKELEKTKSR